MSSGAPAAAPALSHRAVLGIAVPVMLSNVSTPLLGLVDTGVIGRLPDAAYIGAVAVGGLIFTFAFWAFGFLRMGTTGLTAQALGAGDRDEVAAGLMRALLLAVVIGAGLIALQLPLRALAFAVVGADPEVEHLARGYFAVRIWSAPAALANYALLGWYVGLGRTDTGLVLQLILNLTNMALDVLFVLGLGWDVRGVAFGTTLAEYTAAAAGLALALRHLRGSGAQVSRARVLDVARLRRALSVNSDIMIRSLALIVVFVWFTAAGARQGTVILAANAILMQLISVAAFFLDGLAFAAEALVGRAVGAAQREGLRAAARMTTLWAAGTALGLCAGFALAGPQAIDALTVNAAARSTAREFLPWAAGAPLLGVWAFQLDGIFIGATRTAAMRNAMLVSLVIFLGAWWALRAHGNQGLWLAFYVHYLARTGTLLYCFPALLAAVPASASPAAQQRR